MEKQQFFLKHYSLLLFLLISFIAFFIRILSYPQVFINGSFYPIGYDSYYHMRRILYTTSHFPDSFRFDSYINFPYGSDIAWPPLFDQTASLLALIMGFLSQNRFNVEMSAAFFPVLLGIITLIPLYFAGSRIFNRNVALVSIFILAVLPAHITKSLLGAVDHHVAEILLSTTAYALYITALKHSDINDLSLANLRKEIIHSKPVIYAALTGVFFTISLLTWIGSPIFIGLLVIYVFVQFTIDLKENRSSEYLTIISIVPLLVTLVLIIPFILTSGRPVFEIHSMFLSFFQIAFVGICIALVLVMSLISRTIRSKHIAWWIYPLLIMILAIIGIFLTRILAPSLFNSMTSGIGYLFRGGIILGTIGEAQPLFFTGNVFTLGPIWYNFTLSFYVAIIAFIVFVRIMVKESYPPEMVFFTVWTLVIFSLTLLQRRFMYLLAINIALLTGFFIIMSFKELKLEKSKNINSNRSARQKKQNVPKVELWKWGVLNIVVVAVILPNLFMGLLDATDPLVPSSDWKESMTWVKDNTPQPSFENNPSITPDYGILSWWDNGNWILYLGDRPVVSNNFQTGMDDTAQFFIEKDEFKARSILDKRNVRYIITDDLMLFKFNSIASLAGKDPDNYRISINEINGKTTLVTYTTSESDKIENTMLWSLHINDGINLGHFRLVYESNLSEIEGLQIRSLNIFEYVKGAKIEGFASPYEIIRAQINVTSNRNRTFTYHNEAMANETGWYQINVPYSSDGTTTKISDSYTIIGLNSQVLKNVSISENDVINGINIRIDLNNELLKKTLMDPAS